MHQRRCPRSITIAPEQQNAADRAEARGIAVMSARRRGWYDVFVEILALAGAANRRDLDEVERHANHLQDIVMRLGIWGRS